MITDESFGIIPFHINNQRQVEYLVIEHQKGHWAFPKGHAEDTDSNPQETAKREFYEETGITTKLVYPNTTFLEQYTFVDPNKKKISKTVTFYLGLVDPSLELNLQEVEVANAAWLNFEEALEKITFDAGKKVISQANSYITNNLSEIIDAQKEEA